MMQNKKIIGLTGGISTGKSTVAKMLIDKGLRVIDADLIARDILNIDSPAYRELVDYFGSDILREDLEIDRDTLGEIIFNDSLKRKKLNDITHPNIMMKIKKEIDRVLESEDLVVVDIPLLIESLDQLNKFNISFDEIVLVTLDYEKQLDRLMDRDGIDRTFAVKKIRAQMPLREKEEYASFIINNNKNLDDLEKEVDFFLNTIL